MTRPIARALAAAQGHHRVHLTMASFQTRRSRAQASASAGLLAVLLLSSWEACLCAPLRGPAAGAPPLAPLAVPVDVANATAAGQPAADPRAPDVFRVNMLTDNADGEIVLEVTRAWAPLGVDRFYALLNDRFYDEAALFRVVRRGCSLWPWRARALSPAPRAASRPVVSPLQMSVGLDRLG